MAHRFPLATVLRYRESVEKREELALQQIELAVARLRRTLQQVSDEIAKAQALREKKMRQPLTAFEVQAMLGDVSIALERRRALVTQLHELEERRNQNFQAYQTARRNRRMVDEVLTRQRDAYQVEQVRNEQKFLDDLFGARSQRS